MNPDYTVLKSEAASPVDAIKIILQDNPGVRANKLSLLDRGQHATEWQFIEKP